MKLVLDASMALAWLFERKNTEEADRATRVLSAVSAAEIIVPTLWHTEVINALLVGERRQVVTEAQVTDYLNRLAKLPIATDPPILENRDILVMAFAREHDLTAYDATYLELALRTNAVLATFDVQLAKAMHRAGGNLFS